MHFKHKPYVIKIFVCIITHLISVTSNNKALRIVGGRDAVRGEFPYVVQMELKKVKQSGVVKYYHKCTGTLLKSTWSLTAGHCIKSLLNTIAKSPAIKGIVRYNSSSDHEYTYSNILSTFLHPNYHLRSSMDRNDIGLLLTEMIAVSTFVKLSSVDYLTLYGGKVLALGYGVTKGCNGSYGVAHSVNKSLQVLDAIVTRCLHYTRLYPSFCLGGACGELSTLCPGDSGGPVLHASGLVGIHSGSHRKNCNEKSHYMLKTFVGIITPVSHYIDWIMNVIKSNTL